MFLKTTSRSYYSILIPDVALIRNNAEVGAKLARRLVELKDCRLKNSFKRKENPKHGRPVSDF